MAFQFTQTGQELQYLADTAEKIAAEYDATASWTTGDYCTYEGTIYRCTANTTGTFDATKWTAVILCDELEGLRTRMSTAEGDISALNTVLTHITDNGWSVIKYPDGIFEATRVTGMQFGAGTAWIAGTYFHLSDTLPMPSCALSVTGFYASPYSTQLCFVVGTSPLSLSGFGVYIADAQSGAVIRYISMRMIGRWQ